MEQSKTQPDSLGTNAFKKALFVNHPYAFPEQGTVETIQKLDRKDLVGFYNDYYSAQNASIVIVGDVNKTEVKKIESTFNESSKHTFRFIGIGLWNLKYCLKSSYWRFGKNFWKNL